MATVVVPPPETRAPVPHEVRRGRPSRRRRLVLTLAIAVVVAGLAALGTLLGINAGGPHQLTAAQLAAGQPGTPVYSEFIAREIAFVNGYVEAQPGSPVYLEQRLQERASINGPGYDGQPGTAVWSEFIQGEIAFMNGTDVFGAQPGSTVYSQFRAGERQPLP